MYLVDKLSLAVLIIFTASCYPAPVVVTVLTGGPGGRNPVVVSTNEYTKPEPEEPPCSVCVYDVGKNVLVGKLDKEIPDFPYPFSKVELVLVKDNEVKELPLTFGTGNLGDSLTQTVEVETGFQSGINSAHLKLTRASGETRKSGPMTLIQ